MRYGVLKRIIAKQGILNELGKIATCLDEPCDAGSQIEKLGEFISIRKLHTKLVQAIQDIDTNLVDRSDAILEMAGQTPSNHKYNARFSASVLLEVNHRLRADCVEYLKHFGDQVISISPFKTTSTKPMSLSVTMLDDVNCHTSHIIQCLTEIPYFPTYSLVIIVYDAAGNKLDTYHLNQCNVIDVEHSTLDVNGGGQITKTLQFTYDNAKHTKWHG